MEKPLEAIGKPWETMKKDGHRCETIEDMIEKHDTRWRKEGTSLKAMKTDREMKKNDGKKMKT